jgi:tRNA(Ile)-lysidine synthase
MMKLVQSVEQTIKNCQWALNGQLVVVAVSGGPDSMALLHILQQLSSALDFKLVVAHVNYGLRAADSDNDEQAVVQFANDLGIPWFCKRIEPIEWAQVRRENMHQVARQWRYQFFVEVAEREQAAYIATAHHLDDHAETVVMQMLRGTGLDGLRGVARERQMANTLLIRPFLHIEKTQLLDYATEHQLPYRVDQSNLSDVYLRNALRHHVMGELRQLFPGGNHALLRLSEIVRDELDYHQLETERLLANNCQKVMTEKGDKYTMSRANFLSLHVALQRRLIKLLLNYLSQHSLEASFALVEQVRAAILSSTAPNFSLTLSSEIHFKRTYDMIEWQQTNEMVANATDLQTSESSYRGRIEQRLVDIDDLTQAQLVTNDEAWFDAEQIILPLHIRTRRPGDCIQTLGMQGSKKVKKLLIDMKIPLDDREHIPLVFDATGRLLWIAGVRRSRHALVTAETQKIIQCSWQQTEV